MSDRDKLLSVLRSVDGRLRLNRNLAHLAAALCWVLAGAIAGVLLGALAVGSPGVLGLSLGQSVFAAVALVVVAVLLARVMRPGSLEVAAAEADRRAGLHDLLKSALWFAREPDGSGWTAMVVERAAAGARSLDPRRLVPTVVPRALRTAAVLAAVLAVTVALAPRLPTLSAMAPGENVTPGAPEDEAGAALRALAEEAARRGDAAMQSRIEKALAVLERPDATADEKRAALAEAGRIAEQGALEAAADRERLRMLADALAGREEFSEVAKALSEGDARRAADALRKVAEARGETADAGEPQAEQGRSAATDGAPNESLREALQSAAQNPGSEGGETQGRIAKAVQHLDEIARRLDAAAAASRTRRKLDAVSTALNRETNLKAARFGQQEGRAEGEGAPESGSADIAGGTMYRQAAVAREQKDGQTDGARSGDASGDAPGDPVLGDELSRVEVQYALERVRSHAEGDADAEGGRRYAASRQGESAVGYAEVQPLYRRAAEEAMSPESIPLRHRAAVKRFFAQEHEPGSRGSDR
jgi:hypothetical protein